MPATALATHQVDDSFGDWGSDRAAIIESVTALEHAWRQALLKSDVEALDEIWSDDYFLSAPDGRRFEKGDCRAAFDRQVFRIDRLDSDIPRVHICNPGVAMVRGRVRVLGALGLPDCDAIVRYVTMYLGAGERWQQAATAVTRVLLLTGPPVAFG